MLAAGLAKYETLPGREGWIRIWECSRFPVIAELRHGYTTDVTDIAWSPMEVS